MQQPVFPGLQALEVLKTRIKPAVALSYRSVGTGAGQSDFNLASNVSKNSFAVGDFTMTTAQWSQAQQSGNPVLHVPLAVGTVSVFHNVPGIPTVSPVGLSDDGPADSQLNSPHPLQSLQGDQGLQLSPCTLALIFNGTITMVSEVPE
jgi:hypothetical protein